MAIKAAWPPQTRQRARELYEETGHSPVETIARLESELGVILPKSTLHAWTRGRPVSADAQTVDGLATRLLRLCSSEMSRLERQTRSLDLDRAGKVAQILKTIEPLTRVKRSTARTLADLSGETTPSDRNEKESHLGASDTASVSANLTALDGV
jgi:transposase-like protein